MCRSLSLHVILIGSVCFYLDPLFFHMSLSLSLTLYCLLRFNAIFLVSVPLYVLSMFDNFSMCQ